MNRNQKIALGVLTLVTAHSVHTYLTVRRTERAKRAEIQTNMETEIEAIRVAEAKMMEKIKNGEYDGKGIKALMTDFKFETIAAHYE